MIERDRESVTRREALSREEIDAGAQRSHAPSRRRSRLPQRLIPLLVFAFIAALIARREIPAVAEGWDRLFTPAQWQMKQACRQSAIDASDNSAFARVIDGGELHETEAGFYIDGLLLGVMGRDGVEQRVEYSCYFDRERQLAKLNRLDAPAPAAVP